MEDKNPCSCCENVFRCNSLPSNNDCVFCTWGSSYCSNYECMLHYEDSCLVGVADKCGSNPKSKVEWEEEEEEE